MITFQDRTSAFTYRIAGIALDRGRVLAHTEPQIENPHWALPGGRGELGEPSIETLRREMAEELGLSAQVGRLVWVAENFYDDKGLNYHEVGLYFLMTFPDAPHFYAQEGMFPGGGFDSAHLLFQWLPLDILDSLPLYPSFLRRGLRALPAETTHIIHRDT
jgi:ADP-ribose pyrophosphatase YjhB (NUDIX family)